MNAWETCTVLIEYSLDNPRRTWHFRLRVMGSYFLIELNMTPVQGSHVHGHATCFRTVDGRESATFCERCSQLLGGSCLDTPEWVCFTETTYWSQALICLSGCFPHSNTLRPSQKLSLSPARKVSHFYLLRWLPMRQTIDASSTAA